MSLSPHKANPPRRVLMVEDNPSDAWLISHLLSAEGSFSLDHVSTLSGTRARLRSERYDAVLLDLSLPDGDESQTLREVARFAEHIPIVALTALEDEALARACLASGIQDYVYKSDLNDTTLLRSLNHAISRHRASEIQRRLESAERQISLGRIAGGVVHEINNLATIVLSNLEVAHQRLEALQVPDPDGQAEVEQLLESFQEDISAMTKMTSIAAELRLFTQGEDTANPVCDLGMVVTRTLRLLESRLRLRAQVTCEIGKILPAAAHESKVSQVLINLLLNAADAIEEGDSTERLISVDAHADGLQALLSVSDTGCGIRPEHLSQIFEPFFSSKPLGRGSGLGLSVCLDLVQAWGGTIRAESQEGQGATFTVTVPLTKSAPWPPKPVPARVPGRTRQRAHILLVDDLDAPRRALRRLLQRDHDVVEAASGHEALERLSTSSVDLVLCDLMMPEMTGMELYERALAVDPQLERRFIFLTGGAFTDDARAAVEGSSLPVLPKPITRSALLEAIAEVLEPTPPPSSEGYPGAS